MSTYICEKCGCIDNSACGGNFWIMSGKRSYYKEDWANEMYLCVECCPSKFDDGSDSEGGKWHNHFEKTFIDDHASKEEILKRATNFEFVNAKRFYEKYYERIKKERMKNEN